MHFTRLADLLVVIGCQPLQLTLLSRSCAEGIFSDILNAFPKGELIVWKLITDWDIKSRALSPLWLRCPVLDTAQVTVVLLGHVEVFLATSLLLLLFLLCGSACSLAFLLLGILFIILNICLRIAISWLLLLLRRLVRTSPVLLLFGFRLLTFFGLSINLFISFITIFSLLGLVLLLLLGFFLRPCLLLVSVLISIHLCRLHCFNVICIFPIQHGWHCLK
mmetsp:Transcript_1120/g.1959  ORF Transcript_1120/g.1959 Transcript_1120/m.1959 type:complete len:220 (-) Transcript_1120:43-702(-)